MMAYYNHNTAVLVRKKFKPCKPWIVRGNPHLSPSLCNHHKTVSIPYSLRLFSELPGSLFSAERLILRLIHLFIPCRCLCGHQSWYLTWKLGGDCNHLCRYHNSIASVDDYLGSTYWKPSLWLVVWLLIILLSVYFYSFKSSFLKFGVLQCLGGSVG